MKSHSLNAAVIFIVVVAVKEIWVKYIGKLSKQNALLFLIESSQVYEDSCIRET